MGRAELGFPLLCLVSYEWEQSHSGVMSYSMTYSISPSLPCPLVLAFLRECQECPNLTKFSGLSPYVHYPNIHSCLHFLSVHSHSIPSLSAY